MDYKELIELLSARAYIRGDELCKDAATAVETLLAERDEAIRMLRGKCSACKYENRWRDEYPCCHCIFKGGMDDNWEWSGFTNLETTQ